MSWRGDFTRDGDFIVSTPKLEVHAQPCAKDKLGEVDCGNDGSELGVGKTEEEGTMKRRGALKESKIKERGRWENSKLSG